MHIYYHVLIRSVSKIQKKLPILKSNTNLRWEGFIANKLAKRYHYYKSAILGTSSITIW